MSGTRVYEGVDRSIWNMVGGNRDCKGVCIVKSRCIELWLGRCTGEFNPVLSRCGVKRTAHGFFDSEPDLASDVLPMMVAERPLAAEDVVLEQSFATSPPLPQKRHRFWLKQRWRSCWVSLPFFRALRRGWSLVSSGWSCWSWCFWWYLKYRSCWSWFYCCCSYFCWNSQWCC